MPALTPEQEMLKQASAGPDFGDRPLDRLIAAAPLPISDMTKHVAVTVSNKTGALPSTPLPGSARQGEGGGLSMPFRDWWTTPNAKTNVAPRNFMDENSARAAWFAALQQPVQAMPDGTALTKEAIANLIYRHTGINARQFPDEYADLVKLVDAVLSAVPGEPGQ